MKNRDMIIQLVLIAALAGFLLFKFLPKGIISDRSMDEVAAQLASGLDAAVYPLRDNQAVKRVLSLDPDQYEGIVVFRTDDLMSANELAIAKSDDRHLLEQFAEAAENRKETQKTVYEGYAPEQEALASQAVIDMEGNYALYYAGDNPQEVIDRFRQVLKGEGQ